MSKHKDAAMSFLKMAGMGKVQEAYDHMGCWAACLEGFAE
jgi:hypothetical protein